MMVTSASCAVVRLDRKPMAAVTFCRFTPASSNRLDTARMTTSLNEYRRREPEPCEGVIDGSTICLRAQ